MKVITEKLLGLFLFQMLHQILAGKQIYGPEFDQKLKETIDDALGRGEFQVRQSNRIYFIGKI